MTIYICLLLIKLFTSANIYLISCQSLQDYYLNCSEYSLTTKNSTIKRLGLSARLHACFNDNPYDITQPPIPFGFPPITLQYDYSVIYLINFEGSKIALMGQMVLGWTDFYRMWDTTQIPLGQIQIPISEIWYPQVSFISSITKRSLKLLEPDDQAVLFPVFVSLFRTNVVEGHCNVNYYRFPFDEQNCVLEFEFSRYFFYVNDVYLTRVNYTFQFQNFVNEEWSLVNVVSMPINVSFKEINVNASGYSTNVLSLQVDNAKVGFQVNLTLHRYPQFYIVNVLVPIVVLTVIGQTAFAIPEHADGKIVVPLTVLLGFMFVQGIVANELPRAEEAPSLGIYVLTCILLSSANVLCCAMCMWIAHMTHRMPKWLHIAVIVVLGTCLFPSQLFIRIYRCCRRKRPAEQHNSTQLEVFTTNATDHSVSQFVPEHHFSIPRANLASIQPSTSTSHQSATVHVFKENAYTNCSDYVMGTNEAALNTNAQTDSATNMEWILAAEVVNRFFGLLHIAGVLAFFFIYVFPLILGYYTNNFD